MQEGDSVMVLGVHRSTRVRCEDPDCERDHSPRTEQRVDIDGVVVEELFRVHYEDGEREGIPGVLVGEEAGNRYVVRLDSGTVVSADAADVEAVT